MRFNKSILIVLLFALSCKKQGPDKVWLCNDQEVITLNGNVKEMVTGDTQYFYKAYFDEKGDLKYTMNRYLTAWEDDSGKHSEITASRIDYHSQYDRAGNRIAIIAQWQGDTTRKSKWEFDNKGRVINCIDDISAPKECTTSHYVYDSKDNIIGYKHIRCVATEPDIHKYKYDNNHLMTESDLLNENMILSKSTFQYLNLDSHNNWTKSIVHTIHYPPMLAGHRTDTITRKITYY